MKQTIIFIFILISSFLHSQDLVYTPISPFFGGDAYNYQQILASAVAQNDFTDEQTQFKAPTALENFTNSLNTRLLSALSQSLFQQELGDTNLTVGTYTFGDLVVEITPGTNGLNVNILNITTGEQTLISIPNSN
ncbi:curli production assembly/transport component CsgF [Polaribacter sp. Hel1_33_78]|jgi:curli production assembly/transport component CsgF|uniref:curli assembly protein CsgF n=1 Tax=Polaribacter sp. Hel1_33_78 TaxID=1336804 RepID=UPI00087AED79|nr:curli assembly protein CsgF [Polaribacter sp. Hel1_33_78]MBT4414387.1 curli assembly protein CsgF [Polaribacter sp.]SDT94328.1 curli production assembly/transport component CsgF [Polaribacter sp. Hel1_33_78]